MLPLDAFKKTEDDHDESSDNSLTHEEEEGDLYLVPRTSRRKPVEKKPKRGKKKEEKEGEEEDFEAPRSRKAKFPTPMFNFFALAINTIALFVAGFSLFHETSGFQSFSPLPLEYVLFTVLGLLAVGISMYASGAKQTAENRKTRSTLTALSLALGVVLILAVGFILLF